MKPKRVAILCSSNGGAFETIHQIIQDLGAPIEFIGLTDRPCGFIDVAQRIDIPLYQIQHDGNEAFSKACSSRCLEHEIDLVLLFYTRLVTSALYKTIPTLNLHPSLLPSFPGFGSVTAAMKRGVRFLGATLHLVDDTADKGPILAQTICPIQSEEQESALQKKSYLQKVYLALVLLEALAQNRLIINLPNNTAEIINAPNGLFSANPPLADPDWRARFNAEQSREQMLVVSE
jgi:phosphoribosylglycinamide formyltransferase-1